MDRLVTLHQTLLAHGHDHARAHFKHPSCLPIPAAAAASPSELPFSSFPTCISNSRRDEEEWTPEHLEILSSLLHRSPRPFSTCRLQPLVRHHKKFRTVDPPPNRKRYKKTTPMSMSGVIDNGFCPAHLAIQMRDGRDVQDVLMESVHLMVRGSLSGTILELGRMGMPLVALETFLWQQDYAHLWPDEGTLLSTIQVLAEASMEERARKLMIIMSNTISMDSNNSNPILSRFEALIRGLVFSRRLHEALYVKEEVESHGFTLTQNSYAGLILLASRLNREHVVKSLIKEMGGFPELNLGLEQVTSVMAACRKARMYEVVPSLFMWWKSAGFLPNTIMFEITVTSLSSMGKHRDALAMYWEMEEIGCCLDLLVYKAFFTACLELHDSTKALKLFSRMEDSQIVPDRDVYECLIRVCCKDGRFGKAQVYFDAMKRADMPTLCTLEDYI